MVGITDVAESASRRELTEEVPRLQAVSHPRRDEIKRLQEEIAQLQQAQRDVNTATVGIHLYRDAQGQPTDGTSVVHSAF
jgi:hypothetical protein